MTRPAASIVMAMVLALAAAPVARAATWVVDPARSSLGFTGQQTGAPFSGRFKTWTATIDFDPAKPDAARVTATVDVASAATGDAQKDEAMPGTDWFDAARFATATFEASGFTPKGNGSFETTGKLAIRGLAKDVVLPFTLTLSGSEAHAVGKATIVRTDFGIGQGAWAGGDMVALEVEVDVDLVASRKP